MIPVSKPSIGKEELAAVKKVFDSGWLGMGSSVKEFEDKISKFLGSSTVIAVNTGTTAIHLALDALGISKNDEVIVPSLTFVATIQAITATGATPVFCDIEPNTLNIDVKDVERKITSRTKAVIPVHYRGLPCDMDALISVTKKNNIRIVEDAAHAFGSRYKGKPVGSFGDVTCFSFDPIKVVTCGEGGAIAIRDSSLASLIQKKRILGIDKDTWSRYKHERSWFYDVLVPGYRYHMSNINAAIGLVQLKKFKKLNAKRIKIAKRYDRELGKISGLELLKTGYKDIAFFMYIIKVKKDRDALMKHLKESGIDSGIHYIPSHLFTLYKGFATKLPATEKVWEEILTLPLYPDLTATDQTKVINAIKAFFKK
ncbi:MAG: DegT/DnrJ/EryC1/StrS aminotransferase family protein [bacterium]